MRIRLPSKVAIQFAAVLALTVPVVGAGAADDAVEASRPAVDASFTTVFTPALGIEGLTGDGDGNLYAAARGGSNPCPVYRVPAAAPGAAEVVGTIAAPCGPAGLAFGPDGRLYIADSGRIVVLRPDAATPPQATVFAGGVPGSNGIAFDRRGRLWVSDGGTGQGRVWRIGNVNGTDGVPTEVFRVQPMVNEVNLVNGVGGVGRDPRSAPPAAVTVTPNGRSAANTEGSQHLVANGLAFDQDGTLFIADTARGAIWRVSLDEAGEPRSPVGCDSTFPPDTLCLDNVLVAHPYLEGVDGIALDRAGTIWGTANERNAVVTVSRNGRVVEFFRNPADAASRLRNGGPLEFPTSPFLLGDRLCITQSDGSRRDNFPSTGGEVGPQLSGRAKISCLDQQLRVPGLPLPVR